MNGALLIHKKEGISSFGVIEELQKHLRSTQNLKRHDLPKFGHGGTLDPFASGLLIVLIGRGVKLSRYFLGSRKRYQGTIRLGETTLSGDPTCPISETSQAPMPSLEALQTRATQMCTEPYWQTPPMHSAKKKNGKPLYELARAGIEIEREPKLCHLSDFTLHDYRAPQVDFEVECSSGTYIRTLSKDLAQSLGTLALLDRLHRTASGRFSVDSAWTLESILQVSLPWDQLPCWVPFDRLLDHFPQALATQEEALALLHGQQHVLNALVEKASLPPSSPRSSLTECLAIYHESHLIGVARRAPLSWEIERVFSDLIPNPS